MTLARSMGLGPALLASVLAACAPTLRGGRTVSAGSVPGEVVAIYDPKPCTDVRGGAMDWRSRLFIVRTSDGGEVVVEARAQYDSMVYESWFADQGDRVYHLAVQSRGERARLHEVRIPVSGATGGSFRVAPLLEARGRGGGFRGRGGEPTVMCELTRVNRTESVDKASEASKLPPS